MRKNTNKKWFNMTLSISKVYTIYDPMNDKEFKDVFVRADNNMYAEKDAFHRSKRK